MDFKNALFVNPFGLGDAMFTLYAVREFTRAYPRCRVGFVCNERTEPLVRMYEPVGERHVFNRDLLRRAWKKSPLLGARVLREFLGGIRRAGYDAAFDYSLGREFSFWLFCLGVRRRAGLDYRGRGIFLDRRVRVDGYEAEGRHAADTQIGLLAAAGVAAGHEGAALGLRVPQAAGDEAERILRRVPAPSADGWLAVAPGGGRTWGANARFKQWDAESFAAVADETYARFGLRPVLIGDAFEKGLLLKTAARMTRVQPLVVCGRRLETVAAILSRARLFLGNDGGLLHLGNALGVPTVSVFGPVDERVYGPYRAGPRSAVVTHAVECRPCYRKFRFPPCPHERRCLGELATDRVIAAVEKSLTL